MLYFLTLCCGKCVYVQERGNHPAVYLASLSSSHSAHFFSKCHGETLLYEKWSSTSLFHITFSVTRRLESEGGALWRNTLALGICTGAVIFTGATQLSEWGENIFFYRERRLNKPLTVEAVAQLI